MKSFPYCNSRKYQQVLMELEKNEGKIKEKLFF